MSRNGAPPRDVYSPYEVVKVLPGKPITFVCQSNEWEDVVTHWYGEHSIMCAGDEDCPVDMHMMPQIWKGYMLGNPFNSETTCVFQITPLAAYMLQPFTENGRGLLGAIIKMERKGVRTNSPLEARVKGWDKTVIEIPYERLERTVNVIYRKYAKVKPSCVESN